MCSDTLRRMSGSTHSPIGLVGKMVRASRGEAGPGEVKVHIRGGTETFIARSREPITAGSSVLVLSNPAPRTVEVTPWDDPLDIGPNP
jgi:hypothetical protein